ncbi:nucleotide exchange factor GrpE [Aestuariivirga litoralis]|uniref:nucleotide exchange factor GrpE n=1 Tax=Aestuariivirga litoralis TaxID=2650924 RepID=UPI0018C4E6CC|nr:nucleotide exchange factor GrpE [Aestuariivirga litoralis]MBG1233821.1 nucleotide exchange factor GrpE [Aestuariivirga litoralis]
MSRDDDFPEELAGHFDQPETESDEKDLEIETLKEQVAESKDRLLRLAADMDNLRKRAEREKAEATLYAATNFARDLLSVADNLGRALQALPEQERDHAGEVEKNLITGVEMTERELLSTFQRHGIRKLETVGQKFDPNFHQAIFEVPTSEKPPGIVMQEMQAGYAVGDRCLRPAMVGVSKAEG